MVGQFTRKFAPPQVDRLGIKPGDAGELGDTGTLWVVSKGGDIPAALGFGHAAQQQVDLVVAADHGCICPRCTGATGAVMDRWERFGHGRVALPVGRQSIILWKLFFYDP